MAGVRYEKVINEWLVLGEDGLEYEIQNVHTIEESVTSQGDLTQTIVGRKLQLSDGRHVKMLADEEKFEIVGYNIKLSPIE